MRSEAERRAAASDAARYQPIVGSAYHLLGCLGSGGMGVVFEAIHPATRRRVAIKFPAISGDLWRRTRARRRFVQEARALARLRNDRVVRILGCGVGSEGSPYLVMERLVGHPLSQLLVSGPLPLARALPLIRDICQGVGATHAAGLVHRDLKPSNLFVMREAGRERCTVLDFGLATPPGALQRGVFGTMRYMAPEQLSGRAPVDVHSDVFALGLVFLEMLLAPSERGAGGAWDVPCASTAAPWFSPELTDALVGLPAPLSEVVTAAIDPEPCRRPPNAIALLEAIELATGAHGRPLPGASMGRPPAQNPSPGHSPATLETDPSGQWPWRPSPAG